MASLCPASVKWSRLSHPSQSGDRREAGFKPRSGDLFTASVPWEGAGAGGVLSPEAFWALLRGQGRAGQGRGGACPATGHRGAPETRGGPAAQDRTECPSPRRVGGRESVLGGKMGYFPLPPLDTLTPCPQAATAPRGKQSRAHWVRPLGPGSLRCV